MAPGLRAPLQASLAGQVIAALHVVNREGRYDSLFGALSAGAAIVCSIPKRLREASRRPSRFGEEVRRWVA